MPARGGIYSRPLVNVQIEGMVEAPVTCLVDSGAIQNRFHTDFARAARISLTEPDEVCTFSAGGREYTGKVVTVGLKISDLAWEAPVCFVDDWEQDFGILGHEGFFRWFQVCFFAADGKLSISPIDH